MSVGPDVTLVGTEGSLETVPGTEGSDVGASGQGYDIDGEKFTDEQIREAIEAQRDRDTWEASYKQRDQKNAALRGAVEAGFGKKITDLDENDLRDLKAFGLINAKLRAEPAFAKAWEESLVNAYRKAGATPAAAEAAAAKDVAAAKSGEPVKLPDEVTKRLGKIDDFENMIVEQGLTQFQGRLEVDIKGAIDKAAGDLTGKFGPMLRNMVLQNLQGYSDVELLEGYQSGALQREIAKVSRESAKTVREWLAEKGQAAGDRLAASKGNAAPAPTKGGGTAERVDVAEAKPGAGLGRMTDRFIRDLGPRNR